MLLRHTIFALLSSIFLMLFVTTVSDYGVTYDEATGELFLGDRYYSFLSTLNSQHLDFTSRTIDLYSRDDHPDYFAKSGYGIKNAHHVWGFGHVVTSFSKFLFYKHLGIISDPIDAHHLALGFFALLGGIVLYLFCYRWFSWEVALFSVLSFWSYPRYFAHIHNNPKDTPETALYIFVILAFAHGVLTNSYRMVFLSALLWGLALGAKANALFIPVIAGVWLLVELIARYRKGEPCLPKSIGFSLIYFPFLSFLVLLVAWPYLLADFPNGLLKHWQFLLERGAEGSAEWKSISFLNALYTTPPLYLVLYIVGVFTMFREKRGTLPFLFLFWSVIPVLRVSIPYARDFDVIRHWLEFLPGAVVVIGFGFEFIYKQTVKVLRMKLFSFGVLTAVILFPVWQWSIKNHPYQLLYYNSLIGSLEGAQAARHEEANDYWGSSFRKAAEWLNENGDQNSKLYAPFGDHIIAFTEKIWLRDDLELRSINEISPEDLTTPTDTKRYLIVIPRVRHFPRPFRSFDWEGYRSNLVHEVLVDGGVVYRIYSF